VSENEVTLLIKTFFVLQEERREGGRKKDNGDKKTQDESEGESWKKSDMGGRGIAVGSYCLCSWRRAERKAWYHGMICNRFRINLCSRFANLLLLIPFLTMLVQLGRRRLEIFFQNAIPSVKSLESLRIVVPQEKLSKWRRKSICVCVSVCVFTSLLPGVADTEGKQGQERCRVQ
jgi:hypothetical protein